MHLVCMFSHVDMKTHKGIPMKKLSVCFMFLLSSFSAVTQAAPSPSIGVTSSINNYSGDLCEICAFAACTGCDYFTLTPEKERALVGIRGKE